MIRIFKLGFLLAAIFIAGEINLVGAEGARVPPKLSGK